VSDGPGRRLALVTGTLQGGGAERQMAEMANYWAGKDVDVTVATWSGAGVEDFYRLDPRVRRAHLDLQESAGGIARLLSNSRRVLKLRQLLAKQRPEAVLSFLPESNVRTILAGLGTPIRVVVAERAHPANDSTVRPAWRLLRSALYRWCYCLVAQTRETADWMERSFRRRTAVIPNALRALPRPDESRDALVLAVGRLTRQKGFDLLLRAFARNAGSFEGWTLAIAGVGSEAESLVRLRDELGVSDRVTFLGEVKNVEALMARASLVVQPSRFEGFPNVVLEAMGMGAAVISSDCRAGPRDLIEDGVNGRLVPVENVEALSAAMAQLMARPADRSRLGREALKVRERFRQDVVMARWEDVLFGREWAAEGR
jgi:glycosyltransferase involved in cell wall biosynthesis